MWRYFLLNMLWGFLALILSPVLVLQAIKSRRETPRLPEAQGPRQGTVGSEVKPSIHLLFLGDSTIAGVGAKYISEALAGQLVRLLADRYKVHYDILGTNGHRVTDLIKRIRGYDGIELDYIIVEVGVNDVTKLTSIYQWQRSLKALTYLLKSKFPAANIIYNGLPPVYLFTALPQPLRLIAGIRTLLFNSILARHCKRHKVAYAPIAFSADIDNLAEDGYHPSEKAYAIWAEGLYREFIHKT